MNINKEYLDTAVLDEGFNLSRLWKFREDVAKVKLKLDGLKSKALSTGEVTKAVDYGRQLHFVVRNLESVEAVMMEKENDVFIFTEYCDICLN